MSARRSTRAFNSTSSVSGKPHPRLARGAVLAAGNGHKRSAFQRRGLVKATSGIAVGLPASGKSFRNGK